jgi:hypothetical protein
LQRITKPIDGLLVFSNADLVLLLLSFLLLAGEILLVGVRNADDLGINLLCEVGGLFEEAFRVKDVSLRAAYIALWLRVRCRRF